MHEHETSGFFNITHIKVYLKIYSSRNVIILSERRLSYFLFIFIKYIFQEQNI